MIRSSSRTFAFGGGILGLATFLFLGLLPSIVYGGFAGMTLATAIRGGPAEGSLLAQVLVIFGMVVGLLGTAAMFTVVGAALGAGAHAAGRALWRAGAAAADGGRTKS